MATFVAMLAVCALGLATATAASAAEPLVAQWSLDSHQTSGGNDSTPDVSGNALSLTSPAGTMQMGTAGGKFSGYLSSTNTTVLQTTSSLLAPARLTLLAWIKQTGDPGVLHYIAGRGDDGITCGGSSYALYTGYPGNPGLHFYIRSGNANYLTDAPATASVFDGNWHLVAGTFDGTSIHLYVDGNEVGTAKTAGAINYSLPDSSFYVDGYPYAACGGSPDFPGLVDEVRVYDRALTATELGRLAAAPGPTPPDLVPDPTSTTTTTTTSTTTTTTSSSPAPPHASFTGPSSTAPATPITLNAGATTGATTLQWSVNGQPEASCSAQTPNLTLSVPYRSNVSLTALGPGGSSTSSQIITLNGSYRAPPKGAAQFLNTAICSGGPPQLDLTPHGGPPAGCTTTVSAGIVSAIGCLTPVSDPSAVPAGEAAILNGMLASYQADPNWQAYGKWYCTNIAHCAKQLQATLLGIRLRPILITAQLYVSRQPVRINGVDFIPRGGASIAISPGFQRVVSSNALVEVGGVPIQIGQINLDVSETCGGGCAHVEQPIASFDSRGLPGAGDFPFTGTADINFVRNGADLYSEIHGHVELPASLGGITVDGTLRADNTNGIQPESFHGHLDGLGYDDIGLTDVDIYFQAPSDWAFYGNLGIGAAEIRLTPLPEEPYNGIVFHNGSLDHAGATLDLTKDPPEIAPGVDLDKIGLSFHTGPSALRGTVTLSALELADVTGNMVLAFPSPSSPPFQLGPLDLPGAPAALLKQTYTSSPVIGVGGTVDVPIPDVGNIRLGSGYLLYVAPGYVAAGGEVDTGIEDLLTVGGKLDGELNVANRRFNLSGNVHGCVEDVCGNGDVAISSAGAGLCFGDFGGGFKWSDFPTPHLYARVSVFGVGVGTACDVTKFEEDHVFATGDRAHGASAARTVVVRRGKALPEVRVDGDSGAPNVTITGPGGQSLTAGGVGVHRGGSIIVVQSERARETVIGFTRSVPGTYTITPLPGPAVVHSFHTSEPAPLSISGRVTGSGTRRVLHYVASRQPGQRVTFLQVVHGLAREIGSTSGGRGTVRFTTPTGTGARAVVAAVTENGVGASAAQHVAVARFRGPGFVHPGRVGGLFAHWRRGALSVSWRPASNAARYVVTLRESRGGLVRLTTRSRELRLAAAKETLAGVVSVIALSADGSRGPAASVHYRAGRKPSSRFRPFSELRKRSGR